MLTDKNDLVVDPFAGSCMTGLVAEDMNRKWVCIEQEINYINGAKGRFEITDNKTNDMINTKPYEIYAPNFNSFTEKDVPLIQNGGKTR
jgi:DNA modification methylase